MVDPLSLIYSELWWMQITEVAPFLQVTLKVRSHKAAVVAEARKVLIGPCLAMVNKKRSRHQFRLQSDYT